MRTSSVAIGIVGCLSLLATASCSSDEFEPTASGGKSGDAGVGGSGGSGGGKGGSGGSGGSGGATGGSGGSGGSGGATGGSGGSGGATGGTGGATGGTGGASGSGGATGGTGGTPGCTSDTECDDQKACNGKETCASGTCKPGTPVSCPNSDAAHCVAECVEVSAGVSACNTKGKDADGDKHLDKACAASSVTADDCDDSKPSVYPGASEICDGLDNDCNGKDELDEGTPPVGGSANFSDGSSDSIRPAIAWSPTNKHYGVVWQDVAVGIRYVRMSPAGSMVGTPVTVSAQLQPARIAWSGAHFGVAWHDAQKIYFRRVAPDGTFPEAAKVVSAANAKASDPDLAATPSGWVTVWSDTRASTFGLLHARSIGADGVVAGTSDTQVGNTGGSNKSPSVASNGVSFMVAAERGALSVANQIQGFNLSSVLVATGEKIVSADPPPSGIIADRPVVASTANGWSFAWRESSSGGLSLRYYEQLASGAAGCAPVAVPIPQSLFVGGVAARGSSRVVVLGQEEGVPAKARLVRFKAGCVSPVQYTMGLPDAPNLDYMGMAVAWSDNSFVAMWVDQTTGTYTLRRWVSGPNLCDAPVP